MGSASSTLDLHDLGWLAKSSTFLSESCIDKYFPCTSECFFLSILRFILWFQAEDVIGSLLKEYLAPHPKQEEISPMEKDVKTSEKIDSAEDAIKPETSSDQQLDCQQELCSLESENKDVENQLCSTSESGTTLLQHFKNIVAIVDPPRVGLHPTVSCTNLICMELSLRSICYTNSIYFQSSWYRYGCFGSSDW